MASRYTPRKMRKAEHPWSRGMGWARDYKAGEAMARKEARKRRQSKFVRENNPPRRA